MAHSERFELLDVPVIVTDEHSRILFANQYLLDLTDQSNEQVLDCDFFEAVLDADEQDWMRDRFSRRIEKDSLLTYTATITSPQLTLAQCALEHCI